jgi:uncharacterized membrane protein required for colicin V production
MTFLTSLSLADLIIIGIMAAFVLSGLWWGIIHMIGSLAGLALGAFVAGRFFERVAIWGQGGFGGNLNAWRIAAFFLIFIIVIRIAGLIVSAIDAAFKFLSIIPFLSTFNRLLGAALGFIEGLLVISLVIYFAARFPVTMHFADTLRDSPIAAKLNVIGSLLAALLPLAVRLLNSVYPQLSAALKL